MSSYESVMPGGGPTVSHLVFTEDGRGFSGLVGMTLQDAAVFALLQNPNVLEIVNVHGREDESFSECLARLSMAYIEAREEQPRVQHKDSNSNSSRENYDGNS